MVRSFQIVSSVLGWSALVLGITSMARPTWLVFINGNAGLFELCRSSQCVYESPVLLTVFVSVAMLVLFIGNVIVVVTMKGERQAALVAGSSLLVIAGVCILVPAAIINRYGLFDVGKLFNTGEVGVWFGDASYLACVTFGLSCLAGFAGFAATCQKDNLLL